MSSADPYSVLGVERNATQDQIKSAYRKLAKELHPDRNPGNKASEQKFKGVNEAYDILKDPKQREAYDTYGHAGNQHQRGNPFGGGSMSDIFEDLFRGAAGHGGNMRGSQNSARQGGNLRYEMEISLEDVLNGRREVINISSRVKCDGCEGSGAKKGTRPIVCDECNGVGTIRSTQGFFTMERTCPKCQGLGEIIADPCVKCGGSGRQLKKRKLEIQIPAGVEDDTRLRIQGEGEAGINGGPSGDLYVFFSVKSHLLFDRSGSNLYCHVTIPMTKAALGGPIEIVDLSGVKVEVLIPPGTQHGSRQRLRGKGLPHLRSKARGDLFLVVQVEIPVKLNTNQKQLLEKFESETDSKNQPKSEGFLGNIKEFFNGLRDN